MRLITLALAAAALTSQAALAAPLMSSEWAKQACTYWNTNSALTTELAEHWATNDKGRGYKIIHMYRTECGENSKVEMTISTKGGKTKQAKRGAERVGAAKVAAPTGRSDTRVGSQKTGGDSAAARAKRLDGQFI